MSKDNSSSTKNDQNKSNNTGKEKNKETNLEKELEKQANTIARLENEIKSISDPNKEPRIIQRGKQKHPRYVSNNIKTLATIPKEQVK